ncbi:uncharacterized protein BJ212DRAFT_1298207 [Suillus subaureus]|uniref:DUF6533 domain-containing protein n=1 Tax=Suillus subaureus TaxID=48587 RepID=A0A9P7JFU4_9AGAM|nr:uncharacterized protein BJ212DRAFT_1298207 [Suillus subaureus]KAG1819789.1 hypothetical protein BJ212DRAFT_1298207 [Suillus subaureus]
MSTIITPEEIQALDLYLLTAPKIKSISIAALTLFTWDLILTFPHEVRLWYVGQQDDQDFSQNTRWTFAKVLFFVNRYFAFGTAILMTFLTFDVTPTEAICKLKNSQPLSCPHRRSGSVNAFFAVIDKRIVVPVSMLFFTIFSFMMMMAVVVYLYEKDHEAQIFGACCLLGSVDWLYLFWVPMMGLDFVLVVLAGYKSLQHYLRVPDKTWSGARLMRTFARDSVLYFLCTLLGKFGPSVYYQLGAITITVVPPISANHLLINMYNSAHDKQPTWRTASEVKTSLQLVRDTSRTHHEDIELAFLSTKGSEWTDATLFE